MEFDDVIQRRYSVSTGRNLQAVKFLNILF